MAMLRVVDLATHRALGGLAVSLGFESLLAANINLDLLRLGFGLFGQLDFQHAIVIVGAHLPRVHGNGQRECAGGASVLPLDETEVILYHYLLDLGLAWDSKSVDLYV